MRYYEQEMYKAKMEIEMLNTKIIHSMNTIPALLKH